MSAIDAETYLRLLSERELLAPERSGGGEDPVASVTATLLAAGAIDRDTARRVLADDQLARELRAGGFRHHHRPSLGRPRRGRPIERRSAAALGQAIDVQDGVATLHEILIGRTQSMIRYTWVPGARGDASRRTRRHAGPHGPGRWGATTPISVLDASGNRRTARSGGGGGSSDRWDGELIVQGRLDPGTSWIELDGTRLELDRTTALRSVKIEPLEEDSPLERHLWRMLTSAQSPFGRQFDPEPSLDALAALGLLGAEDPLATAVRAVAEAMPDHWHHMHMGNRSARPTRGLPQPWRSLLARLGRTDGTDRSLFVGATTPVFDGIQIAVHTIAADDRGFEAFTEITPDLLGGAPLGVLPVGWWARDDLGNHHLGAPSHWGGGQGHAQGTLRYWPALHPKATRLELLPSATEHRAVITIALADESGAT